MNLLIDKLPNERKGLKINTDFRSFILFELLMQDNEIKKKDKINIALDLFFEKKPKNINLAFEIILWFYSCGEHKIAESSKVQKSSKLIYSYEYDSELIYTAFLDQYGIDLNEINYLHWFKFKAMFKGLKSDNKICEVMGYRAININEIKDLNRRKQIKKIQKAWALPDLRSEKEKENDFANSLW